MKRIFLSLLLIILLMPMTVLAQEEGVNIKSIELVEKSETATEIDQAKHEGMNIYFRVKFQNLYDKVKYKIIIENTNEKKYEITTTNSFAERDFITYTHSFEEDNNIINSNSSKVLFVEITYSKDIPTNQFLNEKYTEENALAILVDEKDSSSPAPQPSEPITEDPTEQEPTSTEESEIKPPIEEKKDTIEVENPSTGANLPLKIIISILIISLGVYIAIQKKLPLRKISGIIIAIGVSLPAITYAIEQLYVKVNVYVEIEKKQPQSSTKTFTMDCAYKKEYHFNENMTWKEFENSSYNIEGFSVSEDDEYGTYGHKYIIWLTGDNEFQLIYSDSEYIEEKEYECESDPNMGGDCCEYFDEIGSEICGVDVCNVYEERADICCSITEWNEYTCDYDCLYDYGA